MNFGRLKPYQGLENLLEVWKKHQDTFTGDTLLIFSRALDQEYLHKLEQLSEGVNRILMIDNNSLIDDQKYLSDRINSEDLIQTGSNLGYAGGHNVGIKKALNIVSGLYHD